MNLAFDELSWEYTPAEEKEPGCLDCFWLEFDAAQDSEGDTAQRLQIFSKQVSCYNIVSIYLIYWKT